MAYNTILDRTGLCTGVVLLHFVQKLLLEIVQNTLSLANKKMRLASCSSNGSASRSV